MPFAPPLQPGVGPGGQGQQPAPHVAAASLQRLEALEAIEQGPVRGGGWRGVRPMAQAAHRQQREGVDAQAVAVGFAADGVAPEQVGDAGGPQRVGVLEGPDVLADRGHRRVIRPAAQRGRGGAQAAVHRVDPAGPGEGQVGGGAGGGGAGGGGGGAGQAQAAEDLPGGGLGGVGPLPGQARHRRTLSRSLRRCLRRGGSHAPAAGLWRSSCDRSAGSGGCAGRGCGTPPPAPPGAPPAAPAAPPTPRRPCAPG